LRLTLNQSLNERKHYVSELNTSVDAPEVEIGRIKAEPVQRSTVSLVRNISGSQSREAARNPERKSDVNIRSSLTGSETSSLFDQITGNNLAVGDLTDQVFKMRQSLSIQNAKIIDEMNKELAASEHVLTIPSTPPPPKLHPSESSADLFKHLEELQNENDNLSNTVKELTERLMLHEEDSDDEIVTDEHVFALSDSTYSNFDTVIRL